MSSPAWKKATPWLKATSAAASQLRRTRVAMSSSPAAFIMICAAAAVQVLGPAKMRTQAACTP